MDNTIIEELSPRAKNDPAWKEVIEIFFEDFVNFCLPQLASLINWNIPWQSMDTELHQLTPDAKVSKRIVDKLFKVFLKDGREQWVLVHIEIQGDCCQFFAERTFESVWRLHDRYKKPIISCAILTDESKTWRPNFYEVSFAGTILRLDFTTIKMIDYLDQIEELEKSTNPFASVILIQLAALEAKKKSNSERFNFKIALTRSLYKKGYSKEKIIKLYYFLDWLILLPDKIEVKYLKEVYELEGGKKMAYVSSAEWFGMQKGRQEGRQEGEAMVLMRQITRKFGQLPDFYREKIQNTDAETLLMWSDQILDAETIEDVFK